MTAALSVMSPFSMFFDVDGSPLEDGYIYLGPVNTNPEASAISVYWDNALTIPAAQPIRTINGYASRSGSPAQIYIGSVSYSITVRDKNRNLVYTSLDAAHQNIISITQISSNAFYTENYATLAEAATAAVGKKLYVSTLRDGTAITITSESLSGVTLCFLDGYTITINTSLALTNVRIKAGKYQRIFAGAGVVTGTVEIDYPGVPVTWFGSDKTGSTDSITLFNKTRTVARTTNVPVYVPGTYGYFKLSSSYIMDTHGDKIIGDGWGQSIIVINDGGLGTNAAISVRDAYWTQIEGLFIAGIDGSSDNGIEFKHIAGHNANSTVKDCNVAYIDGNAFAVEDGISIQFINCRTEENGGFRPGGLQALANAGLLGSPASNFRIYGVQEIDADTIDVAAAVNKGGGLVGIPVTGHKFAAGYVIIIAGTVNYNGTETVVSVTANEVVITAPYVAEVFTGAETIRNSTTVNNITMLGCQSNGGGSSFGVRVGSSGFQVETFNWIGGLSQGAGSRKEILVNARYGKIDSVHIENGNNSVTSVYTIELLGCSHFSLENIFCTAIGDILISSGSSRCSVRKVSCSGIDINANCVGTIIDDVIYGNSGNGPTAGRIRDFSNSAIITNSNIGSLTGATGDNTSGPRKVLFASNMEHWVSATTMPCGFLKNNAPTVTQEAAIKRSGSYSVKVVAAAANEYIKIFLPSANQLSEQWVTVETWIYNVTTSGLVTVQANINGGATIRSQGITLGAGAWERVLFTFYCPAATLSAVVEFTPSVAGTYYVDEFMVWTGQGGFELPAEVTLDTSATPELTPSNQAFWPDVYFCPAGTNITSFLMPMVGKPFTSLLTGDRTFVAGANMKLTGSVNYVGLTGGTITLVYKSDGVFYETARMVD